MNSNQLSQEKIASLHDGFHTRLNTLIQERIAGIETSDKNTEKQAFVGGLGRLAGRVAGSSPMRAIGRTVSRPGGAVAAGGLAGLGTGYGVNQFANHQRKQKLNNLGFLPRLMLAAQLAASPEAFSKTMRF
jgi:uncharacterized membrane protein YebE (DUF533 family)